MTREFNLLLKRAMSQFVKITRDPSAERADVSLHFVPAEIEDYDGSEESEIDSHFKDQIRRDENGGLTNSLRGYPLNGKVFRAPEGYSAAVAHDGSQKSLSLQESKELRIVGKTKSFYYWNYDRDVDAPDDSLKRALDWIHVSSAIHGASKISD